MNRRMKVVEATIPHALAVARDIRKADRDEIWASHHEMPDAALPRAVARSVGAWTILWDEAPACCFGVAPLTALAETGVIWMLGTPLVEKMGAAFLRYSKRKVGELRGMFRSLVNFIDARNKISLAWVKWLGFTVFAPEPYGIESMPFHRIELLRGTANV